MISNELNGSVSADQSGISVIIVSYNVRDVLSSCLDSVIFSGKSLGCPYEIIVVDNDSHDGTLNLLKPRYPDVIWIASKKNIGFGSACNLGVFSAKYSLLLFLNPDTIIEENTLEVMNGLFKKKEDIGVAGCRIKNPDNTLQLACRRSFPTPLIAGYKFLGLSKLFPNSRNYGKYNLTYLDENEMHEVDAVSGSFICVKKSLFLEVNGFDEDFFMYGEDLDLCYRIKLKGKKNYYTPETNILHFKGESAKSRPIRSLFHFYSAMVIFSKKHLELRMLPTVIFYVGAFGLGILNFFTSRLRKWQRWSIDLILVNVVLFLTTLIYSNYKNFGYIFYTNPFVYLTWNLLLTVLILIFLGYSGDYGKSTQNLRNSTIFIALAVLSLFTCGYFFYEGSFSRIVLGITGLVVFLCLLGWRVIALKGSQLLGKLTSSQKRVVIVGTDARGIAIRDLILDGYLPGYEFIGFISEPGTPISPETRDEMVCGLDSIPGVCKNIEIHEIIITKNNNAYQTALKIFSMNLGKETAVKILVGEPNPGSIALIDLNCTR